MRWSNYSTVRSLHNRTMREFGKEWDNGEPKKKRGNSSEEHRTDHIQSNNLAKNIWRHCVSLFCMVKSIYIYIYTYIYIYVYTHAEVWESEDEKQKTQQEQ
jgi:hypothetical protein